MPDWAWCFLGAVVLVVAAIWGVDAWCTSRVNKVCFAGNRRHRVSDQTVTVVIGSWVFWALVYIVVAIVVVLGFAYVAMVGSDQF